jgi:hypothetical protein
MYPVGYDQTLYHCTFNPGKPNEPPNAKVKRERKTDRRRSTKTLETKTQPMQHAPLVQRRLKPRKIEKRGGKSK